MNFVDFAELLDVEAANLALLSSFSFEPDYFERKLLKSRALSRARRIVVFMDAGQWEQLRTQPAPGRWMNRRYLVVPVRVEHRCGVFHPKLQLFLFGESGLVLCGSNNLTRAGCTQNLELVNSIPFSWLEGDSDENADLARAAFEFFELLAAKTKGDAMSVAKAKAWLEEEKRTVSLSVSNDRRADGVRLVHTLEASLWDQLQVLTKAAPPRQIRLLSPFFDPDAEMLRRIQKTWPTCKLEIIAQQHTSNLPTTAIDESGLRISLRELVCRKHRRLHAKLFAWESKAGGGCFAGSANLTAAAWDGRNIEACLYFPRPAKLLESLFGREVSTRSIRVNDFVPSPEREPGPSADETSDQFGVRSAMLSCARQLRVQYYCDSALGASRMTIVVRATGERDRRTCVSVVQEGEVTIHIDEQHGDSCLVVFAIAHLAAAERNSRPYWVIQEERLTNDPTGSDSRDVRVGSAGDSFARLLELLDEQAARGGPESVVTFLNQFNVPFRRASVASGGPSLLDQCQARRSDSSDSDVLDEPHAPRASSDVDLNRAIVRFARRHEEKLKKHAASGNLEPGRDGEFPGDLRRDRSVAVRLLPARSDRERNPRSARKALPGNRDNGC
ncbi:MAG: hypothetical protein HYS13_06080 [Planctomycetia bacterium]|nr:hypothetical protein [Planctomycetia bacterium]